VAGRRPTDKPRDVDAGGRGDAVEGKGPSSSREIYKFNASRVPSFMGEGASVRQVLKQSNATVVSGRGVCVCFVYMYVCTYIHTYMHTYI
jgi:hypothetical protein